MRRTDPLPFILLLLLLAVPAAVSASALSTGQNTGQNAAQDSTRTLTVSRLEMLPAHSRLTYTATVNGAANTGSFEEFAAELYFHPDHLDNSRVKVTVDMDSVNNPYEEIAIQLRTPIWFDTVQYPTAVFETTAFRKTGADRYEADATLTLRDQTHPITLQFTLQYFGEKGAEVSGQTSFSRTAFGVGQGEWKKTNIVSDPVNVNFEITAAPSDE